MGKQGQQLFLINDTCHFATEQVETLSPQRTMRPTPVQGWPETNKQQQQQQQQPRC